MARYIRVAALNRPGISYTAGMDFEKQIKMATDAWDKRLEDTVLHSGCDFIVLPEICDALAGAPREVLNEFYRFRGMKIRDHFASIATAYNVNIAYSAILEEPDGTFRNATHFINRNGGIDGFYNKNYCTILGMENGGTLNGRETNIINTDVGKVAGAICFDLNFTDLMLRTAALKPEIIAYSGAYHGGLMQSTWAYLCRSYFVGSQTGALQRCTVLNPLGTLIAESTDYEPFTVADINLDYKVIHLDYNRGKFPELRRHYGKKAKLTIPEFLGPALLTSECDELTSDDIIREFELEQIDDYLIRSAKMREQYLEP
jgi:predicted amidohydrolase